MPFRQVVVLKCRCRIFQVLIAGILHIGAGRRGLSTT